MRSEIAQATRWVSADLDAFPDHDGKRYEIIDGELYVSKQPSLWHDFAARQVWRALQTWSEETGLGTAFGTAGLVFAEDDDVVPDALWVAATRLPAIVDHAGHLRAAPDLVVEVLSPGRGNERRDREAKLDLYSRRGVQEYWIVDWIGREVEAYRPRDGKLQRIATLRLGDTLESPLLPGFAAPLTALLAGLPDV